MFPFILSFTVCFAATPHACQPREMLIETSSTMGCALAGQQMIAFYISRRPKVFFKTSEGFKCKPMSKKEQNI